MQHPLSLAANFFVLFSNLNNDNHQILISLAVHSSRRLLALHFFPCEFEKFIKPTKNQGRKVLSNDPVMAVDKRNRLYHDYK